MFLYAGIRRGVRPEGRLAEFWRKRSSLDWENASRSPETPTPVASLSISGLPSPQGPGSQELIQHPQSSNLEAHHEAHDNQQRGEDQRMVNRETVVRLKC